MASFQSKTVPLPGRKPASFMFSHYNANPCAFFSLTISPKTIWNYSANTGDRSVFFPHTPAQRKNPESLSEGETRVKLRKNSESLREGP